jgi:hypothetical protein
LRRAGDRAAESEDGRPSPDHPGSVACDKDVVIVIGHMSSRIMPRLWGWDLGPAHGSEQARIGELRMQFAEKCRN